MDEPTSITVRIPGRMTQRWNALLAGRGHGKLEFTIRGGEVYIVRLEETFEVQTQELHPRR